MKIEDIIRDYPDDYRLKVGAYDGNGYFYCGTVSDWNKSCNVYCETLKQHISDRLARTKKESIGMVRNFCKDIIKDCSDSVSDSYIESLDNRIISISRSINYKNNSKKRLNDYIPIKDREVVEYFEADLAVEYPECLIILIKGSESGKFWDESEAKEEHLGINTAAESSMIGMGV